jgi:hypothetical protein
MNKKLIPHFWSIKRCDFQSTLTQNTRSRSRDAHGSISDPSKDTTFDRGARKVTWELGGRERRGCQRTDRPACGKQRYPACGHGDAEMGGGGGWGTEREEHLHLAEPPRRDAVV